MFSSPLANAIKEKISKEREEGKHLPYICQPRPDPVLLGKCREISCVRSVGVR